MNQKQLDQMKKGQGFISALDQSGGSTPRTLRNYGVPETSYEGDDEMFAKVHEMRSRIVSCPAYSNDRIIGAIIFENTMEREVEGKKTADYLWEEKGIVPFLKTDVGMAAEVDGVRLMKPMPGLDDLLKRALERNIFGTKMRSVILRANPQGIKKIVDQQFDRAGKIASYGLVPIIEPEVDIHISDKAEAEEILLRELQDHLKNVDFPLIFKLTLPTKPNLYKELLADPHVILLVALSGGYSRQEACAKLAQNQGMVASFSRAFLEGLRCDQSDAEFAKVLQQNSQEIYAASMA